MPGPERSPARVLNPIWIESRQCYRVIIVGPDGRRSSRERSPDGSKFDEARAWDFFRKVSAKLSAASETTVEKAIAVYRQKHLLAKGNKDVSVEGVVYRLTKFFEPDLKRRVSSLTEERCQILYRGRWEGERVVEEGLMQRPTRTGEPMSVDSHRSCLADAKTFMRWCAAEAIIPSSPVEKVKGEGHRNHGGRGRAELRRKELRQFFRKALELAESGDQGEQERATGALLALLCGMRAGEIVSRRVRDLDDEEWTLGVDVHSAKTATSERIFEVPKAIRPHLKRLCVGKQPDDFIFSGDTRDGRHWRDWVRKSVRMVCRKAKLPFETAHGLRGGHSDLAREAGATGELVAQQLGHTGKAVTERSYTSRRAAHRSTQATALQVLEGGRKGRAG